MYAKGLAGLRQEISRRVIRTENQNPVSYADQPDYSSISREEDEEELK